MHHHIVILGGGFGGIRTARSLAAYNIPNTTITLISNKTYFEYYPALYRIVTGASPIEVCVSLNDLLPKNVGVIEATITEIDLEGKKIMIGDGAPVLFDSLIVALGSETSYFNLPGVNTLSLGFKSVKEALKLKAHLGSLFDEHKHPSPAEMVAHFHVVIVGGGPSGVEVAGDLAVYLRKLALAHKIDPSLITIDLIEGTSRILPTLPEDVSVHVTQKLRALGINLFLNRFLMSEDIENVYLKDMQMQSKTVIWTAGTRLNTLLTNTKGFTFSKRKRVVVDAHLRPEGFSNVYVIGDAAETTFSGLAQTALNDGNFVAEVINADLRKRPLPTYKPKSVAYGIPVGEKWAAFVIGGFRTYGYIAYLIRHFIDFIFFASMLPPNTLWRMYTDGYKYRDKK